MSAPHVTRPALMSAVGYMLEAAGITVSELAQHMGQGHDRRQPAPELPAERALSDNDRRIIEAADCDDGITLGGVKDLLGVGDAQAHKLCARLRGSRHLICVKKPGIRAMRFFARPAAAAEWLAARERPVPPVQIAPAAFPVAVDAAAPAVIVLTAAEIRSAQTFVAKVAGARKAAAIMDHGAARKHQQRKPQQPGEAVRTEKTIETIDSTKRPTAKWQTQQLQPDPRWPSFSSAPLGVNPDTGMAWGAQA